MVGFMPGRLQPVHGRHRWQDAMSRSQRAIATWSDLGNSTFHPKNDDQVDPRILQFVAGRQFDLIQSLATLPKEAEPCLRHLQQLPDC